MNKNALLFLVLGAAILAGLFWWLRPQTEPQPVSSPAAASAPAAAAPAVREFSGPPPAQGFEITVRNGQRVSGPGDIEVHAGQNVTLKITSDRDDELHLHGYDLHLTLHAGVPATLAFQAAHSGRFDYELHHAHTELGTLNVLPQ